MPKVTVKWGKEKYEVDVDPSQEVEVLHAQLFALTNVPAERQKVLAKGKVIRAKEDLARVKEGGKLMLMGSADPLPTAPKEKVVFLEDLTDEQRAQMLGDQPGVLKSGLRNLGNTCYMASSLQNVRVVPELAEPLKALAAQPQAQALQAPAEERVARELGSTLTAMDRTTQAVAPFGFMAAFRSRFPQFASMSAEGGYHQQDADEALSELLSAMSTCLRAPDGSNAVDAAFGGEMESTMTCDEAPAASDDEVQRERSSFRKLRCHIGQDTNHLHSGLEKGLEEKIEKQSQSLGRNAVWTRKSAITSLPRNLIVQFVRFEWKQRDGAAGVKAKILRRVVFPEILDAAPYCGDKLRRAIQLRRQRDDAKANAAIAGLGGAADEELKRAEQNAAPETVEACNALNHAGNYQLIGVVTHQGRSADGGHYIGWTRQRGDLWQRFDDDKVTEVRTSEILNLAGGGDWHSAYLLIYRLAVDEPAKDDDDGKAGGDDDVVMSSSS